MRNFTLGVVVSLFGLCVVGCNNADPDLTLCEGGACEKQEQCEIECEGVCGSPDFLSFDCVEDACQCECFFGCQ